MRLALAALLLCGSCVPLLDGTPPKSTANDIVASGVASGLPGLAVAVQDPYGRTWIGAAGLARFENEEPLAVTDAFPVGAMTTSFVAVCALQLVDERKLRLGDTLLEVLGEDAVGALPHADEIRVEQVLGQTSGVADFLDDPIFLEMAAGPTRDPDRRWAPDELIAVAARQTPAFAPGERTLYSHTNAVLLGMLVEHADERDLAHSIRARILDPLRLAHTWSYGVEAPRASIVDGHLAVPDDLASLGFGEGLEVAPNGLRVATPLSLPTWEADAIVTTVGDLATFARALLEGRFLRGKTQRLMLSFPVEPFRDGGPVWGLGVAAVRTGDEIAIGFESQTAGHRAYFFRGIDSEVTVVALTNRYDTAFLPELYERLVRRYR